MKSSTLFMRIIDEQQPLLYSLPSTACQYGPNKRIARGVYLWGCAFQMYLQSESRWEAINGPSLNEILLEIDLTQTTYTIVSTQSILGLTKVSSWTCLRLSCALVMGAGRPSWMKRRGQGLFDEKEGYTSSPCAQIYQHATAAEVST